MKKLFSLLVLLLLVAGNSVCVATNAQKKKADQHTATWNYEVETNAKNSSGNYLLKIWSFSKNTFVAEEQAKKNAVHAIVFQGAPENMKKRVAPLKPLLQDPVLEKEHEKFFKDFFADGGEYKRFARMSNSGMADVIKYGKKYYKVGVVVMVEVAALRKHLEQCGVIKALNHGFN